MMSKLQSFAVKLLQQSIRVLCRCLRCPAILKLNVSFKIRVNKLRVNCQEHTLLLLLFLLLGIQPFGQRPEFSQVTGMALVCCILGRFLGVVCHCLPPCVDVPTFATRCLHVCHNAIDPSGRRWNSGRECCQVILPK